MGAGNQPTDNASIQASAERASCVFQRLLLLTRPWDFKPQELHKFNVEAGLAPLKV
jgi:hypothetical protein